MLEKLDTLQDEKAEIKLNWENENESIIVIPLQYLEEEYESYLVEVAESNNKYRKGLLIEVKEKDLEYVNKVE